MQQLLVPALKNRDSACANLPRGDCMCSPSNQVAAISEEQQHLGYFSLMRESKLAYRVPSSFMFSQNTCKTVTFQISALLLVLGEKREIQNKAGGENHSQDFFLPQEVKLEAVNACILYLSTCSSISRALIFKVLLLI